MTAYYSDSTAVLTRILSEQECGDRIIHASVNSNTEVARKEDHNEDQQFCLHSTASLFTCFCLRSCINTNNFYIALQPSCQISSSFIQFQIRLLCSEQPDLLLHNCHIIITQSQSFVMMERMDDSKA